MLDKKPTKKKVPTEDIEQITFLNWFKKEHPNVLIFHIPNGGFRHKATAIQLKLLGVVSGIPDLFIPEFNLWIEMKRTKGSVTSDRQKEIINYLNTIGHSAVICKGYKEAIKAVEAFLDARTR